MYDFFKNLNNTEYDENDLPAADENIGEFNNEILNDKITQDEIMTCIKNLKNGKCAGIDNIINEYIKIHQNPINNVWLTKTVQFTLEDQYKQTWSSEVHTTSKCLNYRMFKTVHKFENYLIDLPLKLRKYFIDFRLCNHSLPIETGRWRRIDQRLRKCNLC